MTIDKTERNSISAFTLLEMMVVLLIASIIVLALGVIAKSTFDVLRASESRSQLTNGATIAVEYIARDIETATGIPLMNDRDMNGVPDDDEVDGYGINARWVVGYESGSRHYVPTNFLMTEAFSDHLKTLHSSVYRIAGSSGVVSEELSPPKNIRIQGQRLANYSSYFRLAVPTSLDSGQPYYLSLYRNNNTYLNYYPELVTVGFRQESYVLTQDLSMAYRSYETPGGTANVGTNPTPGYTYYNFYNQPIGTNITRIRFEYFHEVPVYKVNDAGQAAYRNLSSGSITWHDAPTFDSGGTADVVANSMPIIDHFELRHIDVAANSPDIGGGDTYYNMQDQYTDAFLSDALNGNANYQDQPWGDETAYSAWNIGMYWNDPATDPDNPPPDHYAWTTDGEFRAVRYDTAYFIGYDNSDPTGWDAGNADGIPDGDGIPDDPVPAYWLPYLRAIRITVVATPTSVINKRRNLSGKVRGGRTVYYNPDSPVPFQDALRTVPLTSARDFYVGEGKDIIVTRMVYPRKTFKLQLAIDPGDTRLGETRRADWNFFMGTSASFADPLDPDSLIRPLTPYGKYREKELM